MNRYENGGGTSRAKTTGVVGDGLGTGGESEEAGTAEKQEKLESRVSAFVEEK